MWKKFLPRRHDIQITLMFIVLMLCTFPFYVFYEAQKELEFIFETAERETKVLAQNIAINSVEHIVTRDYSSLEKLLIQSARFPSVIDIQVTDKNGSVTSDVISKDIENTDAESRYSISKIPVPTNPKLKLISEEDHIDIWAPIKSGEHLGWVKISYSMATANEHASKRFNDYLIDGAILTIVISILLILFMRNPLRMFGIAVEFAGRLSKKTGEQIQISHYSKEIEELFSVLNKVSLNLAEQDSVIINILKELGEKNTSLKEATDNLEIKVQQRTAELEKANEKLHRLNNMKSEFVSVVSHELRTPLTSIKSFAEILEDDIEDIDIDTQRHYLSIINEETDRLGRLINDVLDLQKMDAGKTTWNDEKTDLAVMAKTLFELFSKSHQDKGLALSLDIQDESFITEVDADKIQQLTTNLLSNALKFTSEGGVTLSMRSRSYRPQAVLLSKKNEVLFPLLTDLGIDVKRLDDVQDLLELLSNTPYPAELLIVNLPDIDLECTSLMTEIRRCNENIPILLINVLMVSAESLSKYMPVIYINSPVDKLALKTAINNLPSISLDVFNIIPVVEISVTDTGMGMPADELDKVFDRFHQVDRSETREIGGSGLGLSICKDIVEHYHGKIWVESSLGQGSKFSYILPLISNSNEETNHAALESVDFPLESVATITSGT